MKKTIYTIIIYFNLWRLFLIFSTIYFFNTEFRKLLIEDVFRIDELPYRKNLYNIYYNIMFNKAFRGVVSYRIRNYSVICSRIFDIFFPPKVDMEISGNIGGGLRINHGQSSVIVLNKAGSNLTVYQNVTCGRNKNHINLNDNSTFNCYPTIGNNVSIYAGAVVVGGITIGDNVEIGANSVITKNVPSNTIVVGNPPIIVNVNGKKTKTKL